MPVTAGDDHSPVTVERNMHENTQGRSQEYRKGVSECVRALK